MHSSHNQNTTRQQIQVQIPIPAVIVPQVHLLVVGIGLPGETTGRIHLVFCNLFLEDWSAVDEITGLRRGTTVRIQIHSLMVEETDFPVVGVKTSTDQDYNGTSKL